MIKNKRIGFALTGSFCTFEQVFPQMKKLKEEGASILPIVSDSVNKYDTRFFQKDIVIKNLEEITGNSVVSNIVGAEPIGPKKLLDILIVAPCTGNTIAKLSHGITDTPVLMAVKAQLRNLKPVVLAISTNDGLSNNAKNIGILLNIKNMFFVPFGQDNPYKKPNSLVADMNKIIPTIESALINDQIQPMIIKYDI